MEQNSISRLLRKVRTIQAVSFLAQCFLVLISAYLCWKAAGLLTQHYAWSSSILPLIGGSAPVLWIVIRAIGNYWAANDRTNAARIDHEYALKERVTTYVELRTSGHPFLDPLIQESETKLIPVSPWKISRFFSGMAAPTALMLLFAMAPLLIPYLPVPSSILAKKEERKSIIAKAKELEKTAHRLEQKQTTPEMKKLLQEFKKVSQQLQKPDIDKAGALKQLNTLEEKLRKMDAQSQQKLAKDLQNAWNQAKQDDGKNNSLTDYQKAEIDQLAKSMDRAMEGNESLGGHQKETLKMEHFSQNDLQAMKDALKKFNEQKAQAEQMRAQLEEALKEAQQGTSASSTKKRFITDSRLKDREVETGKGGVEDGPGTTNKDSGPSRFDTRKKNAKGEYVEDRTKTEFERLYDGQRENVGKDPLYLQNQWNENGDPGYTHVRNFGVNKNPVLNGAADGLTNQNDQESAVRKERIPPSYREIVKNYFETTDQHR